MDTTQRIPAQTITYTIPETILTVDASQIHSIGYCPERRMAFVRFKSSAERTAYGYPEFAPELWDEWLAAESVGKFFHARVRSQWEGRFVYLPGLDGVRVDQLRRG